MLKTIKNVISGKPILAIFEVCLQCNSACGYCDLPLNEGREELTREQIYTIFSKLYKDGVRYVFLQGGEPMVRKDLFPIIEDMLSIGLRPTLITNGTRLSQERVDRLEKLNIDVSVSLDTLDRARYKIIRGADQLPQVLKGIERLSKTNLSKFITCIVSDQNRNDVTEVAAFARSKGFMPVIGSYHWDIERYGRADPILQYERKAALSVFEKVLRSSAIPKGYFHDYIKDNIQWLKGKPLASCDAGKYSIAIDASGNVSPCLALEHSGNLLEHNLDEILSAMDQAAITQCSNQSRCNMMCSRVIGSNLNNPLSAIRTPKKLSATNIA